MYLVRRISRRLLSLEAGSHRMGTARDALPGQYRESITEGELIEGIESENDIARLKRVFSYENASQPEINKMIKARMIERFQLKPGDTGSTEVQVSILTSRIHYLAEHMKKNRKDFSSKRGLEACVHQRRKLLTYLKRTQYPRYMALIKELSLRDTVRAWPTDRPSNL